MAVLFILSVLIVIGLSIILKAKFTKWILIPLSFKLLLIISTVSCMMWFGIIENNLFDIELTTKAGYYWALFSAIFSLATFNKFREKVSLKQYTN